MDKTESVHISKTESTPRWWLRKTAAIATLSTIALTGCSTQESSAQEETVNSTISEESTVETVEVTPPEEDLTDELEAQVERSIELYNLPKPERFDEYQAMSVEEFWTLPIEDRLEYAMYLNRDAEINMELFHLYTENPKDVMPANIGPENTAEEISSNARTLFRGAITAHFGMLDSVPGYDAVEYSSEDRQKILAGAFLTPNQSQIFINWNGPVAEDKGSNEMPFIYAAGGQLLADETTTNVSENYTITDPWGTERIARDIMVTEDSGEQFTGTQVLIQTSSYSQWVNLK